VIAELIKKGKLSHFIDKGCPQSDWCRKGSPRKSPKKKHSSKREESRQERHGAPPVGT